MGLKKHDMRKQSILFGTSLLLFLNSCESEANKESRLGLDTTARKINLLNKQLVDSKTEEGKQSKLTMSDFYSGYSDKLNDAEESLAMLAITEQYTPAERDMALMMDLIRNYLNTRRELITNVTEASNSYSTYYNQKSKADEYRRDYENSGYRYDFYHDYSMKASVNSINAMLKFIKAKYASMEYADSLFTINDSLHSLIDIYNLKVSESKLSDSIKYINLVDSTGNDWLIDASQTVRDFDISNDD